MQDSKVIPLLFGLELSDLSGPLAQFQALKIDQQGMMKVIKGINAVADNKAAENTIQKLVSVLWKDLENNLNNIPSKGVSEKHERPQTEILEELVSQVRGLGAQMREFDPETMEKEMHYGKMRDRGIHPDQMNEMLHVMSLSSRTDVSLLLLAGFSRDSMPWLAEVLVEAHRELKTATFEQAHEIRKNLNSLVKMTMHSPLGIGKIKREKYGGILFELPHLIDTAISQKLELLKIGTDDKENAS
ncbi:hypothetical protein [Serratia sp. UGAL515B_01]|uniref:hypothetical protein n=1 Tax=Serratia sp. UGAL515B_01 TaxID=2986763 RepID=UPI002952CC41|nr:hypothetical protein [Serratia sp. UGAL515B_01]WON77059.1 hypothetical protein OK023_18140 [Serratia sp. UGAL515B_01]